jgi:hypothetical protein
MMFTRENELVLVVFLFVFHVNLSDVEEKYHEYYV